MKDRKIVLLGSPASGKGTQAEVIKTLLNIPHLSTGDILRGVAKDKSHPLFADVSETLGTGSLVSDDLINEMVKLELAQDKYQDGFLLDGFPRTLDQAEFLEQLAEIDKVIFIDVKDETVIERISDRRLCPSGHGWHLKYKPSKAEGICDICGEALFQRADDTIETVKKRLVAYHQNTEPLLDFYRAKGILITVDGEPSIAEVSESVKKEIEKFND